MDFKFGGDGRRIEPEGEDSMAFTFYYRIRRHSHLLAGWNVVLLGLAIIVAMVTVTGCASSKYKLADKDTPPPVPINLRFNQPPVELLLHTVIVYKGSGSWKRKAYWDEYIITITNRGELPLAINSATLVDFQDKNNTAGNDPWKLEKQSKTWLKNIQSTEAGRLVTIGAGMAASWGVFWVAFPAAWAGSGAAIGVVTVAAAAIYTLPVYAVVSVLGNIVGRQKIESEFNRRRLALPVIVQAGQVIQGSLFFPITAGPKRLILQCQLGEERRDIAFDLSPLAGLHLTEKMTTLPASSSQGPAK
jgi:hypothetical protein